MKRHAIAVVTILALLVAINAAEAGGLLKKLFRCFQGGRRGGRAVATSRARPASPSTDRDIAPDPPPVRKKKAAPKKKAAKKKAAKKKAVAQKNAVTKKDTVVRKDKPKSATPAVVKPAVRVDLPRAVNPPLAGQPPQPPAEAVVRPRAVNPPRPGDPPRPDLSQAVPAANRVKLPTKEQLKDLYQGLPNEPVAAPGDPR